jgi:hypothetical protein
MSMAFYDVLRFSALTGNYQVTPIKGPRQPPSGAADCLAAYEHGSHHDADEGQQPYASHQRLFIANVLEAVTSQPLPKFGG